MSTENLINALQSGDNVEANKAFQDTINQKVHDAVSAKKIEVASGLITRTAKPEEE